MSEEKVYPMDEDYNQALKFLTDQIAERDEMVKQLKLLPPEAQPEGRRLLSELNKAIERGEQALANEYESYQNYQRALEEEANVWESALHSVAGSLIHLKYRYPEKFDEAKAIFTKDWSDEELLAFDDRMAIMEAGDLVRIIRQEGETREEAEEFLRNYRLEEEAKKDALFEDLAERLAMVFIHIKYRHPEKLEEIRAAATNNYTPEEEQAFYDRVAILEAGDLISIIAREGETREQTEEFLKNYRAKQLISKR